MDLIEVTLIGRFTVRRSGTDIQGRFGGRLASTLLRLLATRRGEFISRDSLIEALWPGDTPADPGANLSVLVNRVRRALGSGGFILTGPGGYTLAVNDRCVIDAEEFLKEAAAGHRHLAGSNPAEALRCFTAACGRWRGEPLAEDIYEDWAADIRAELLRTYQQVLEEGARAALELGDHPRATAMAAEAVEKEPLREAGNLLLIRCLAMEGDVAGALFAFGEFQQRLDDELGIRPSKAAFALRSAIVDDDLSDPERRDRAGENAVLPRSNSWPFVGRERELEDLVEAIGPGGGIAAVSGPAGSGKSRLMAEAAERSGAALVGARAFFAEREEPWALARTLLRGVLAVEPDALELLPLRLLRSLREVLPELDVPQPEGTEKLDAQSVRVLAVQGAIRLLSRRSSEVVYLADDLQWADATSLELIAQLAEHVPGLRMLLAYRSDEVESRGMLAGLLDGLRMRPAGITEVQVAALDKDAIRRLVDDESLARVLADHTDGTPFSVREVLDPLHRQGVIDRLPTGEFRAARPEALQKAVEAAEAGKRRTIQLRAAAQPPGRLKILEVLALLGRETPAGLLARASGIDGRDLLQDLTGLARAALVRLGEEGWTTHHDLIGETIAGGLDSAERGRLHATVAGALAEEGADQAEIARHLLGAGDPKAAAEAFAGAAEAALNRYAAEECERLASTGLELYPPAATTMRLLAARAEALSRTGNLTGARQDLRRAMAMQQQGPARSLILTRLAAMAAGPDDFRHSDQLVDLALLEAGSDPRVRAEALAAGAIVDVNLGRLGRAEQRNREALEQFERAGDSRGASRILDIQAMALLLSGQVAEAEPAFDRAARLLEDTGQLLKVAGPRAMRALSLVLMNRAGEAVPEVRQALELNRSFGDRDNETFALTALGLAQAALGSFDEGIGTCRKALDLAMELQHREWTALASWILGTVSLKAGDPSKARVLAIDGIRAAEHLPIHKCHSHSLLAQVLVDTADLAGAQVQVDLAMALPTPFPQHTARLVQAEIVLLRGDEGAHEFAAEAVRFAEQAGYLFELPRLQKLMK